MKLSAAMMEHFRSRGLRHSSLDDDFRKAILQYVDRYLAGGNAAMITMTIRFLRFRAWLNSALCSTR